MKECMSRMEIAFTNNDEIDTMILIVT